METMSFFDPIEWIGRLINSAEKLGALPVAAVWAFVAISEALYIFMDARAQHKARELSQKIRLRDAESDILMAQALDKIADEVRFKIGGMNAES